RQCLERACIRLLLGEEAQHGLGPEEPDTEAVLLLARRVMRVDELDARDGLELAGALVEHQLGVRERLKPRAEARFRLADPLGHRPDTSALERVEVEHAVRFPEPERAQNDRFGLVRAPRHGVFSLVPGVEGNPCSGLFVETEMTRIRIYTTRWCGYCVRAKAILDGKELEYEE